MIKTQPMAQFFLAAAVGIAISRQALASSDSSSTNGGAAAPPKPAQGQIINRHGDVEDQGNLRIADWARRWEKNQLGWHKTVVNPTLEKELKNFRAQPTKDYHPTVVVPLCGKSVDLTFLYQKGYRVVGIEIVTQAIIDFFYENAAIFPKFHAEKLEGTNIYKYSTPDGLLTIFQIDIFSPLLTKQLLGYKESAEEGIEIVWDRASLIALNPHTRAKYAAQLEKLYPKSKPVDYLLATIEYSDPLFHGPPFSVPRAQVTDELYPSFKKELIEIEHGLQMENGPNKPKAVVSALAFRMRRN